MPKYRVAFKITEEYHYDMEAESETAAIVTASQMEHSDWCSIARDYKEKNGRAFDYDSDYDEDVSLLCQHCNEPVENFLGLRCCKKAVKV